MYASCALSIDGESVSTFVGVMGVVRVLTFVLRPPNDGKKDLVFEDPLDRMLDNDISDIALADVEDLDLPTLGYDVSACMESAVISLISRFSMNVMNVRDTLWIGVADIASITIS